MIYSKIFDVLCCVCTVFAFTEATIFTDIKRHNENIVQKNNLIVQKIEELFGSAIREDDPKNASVEAAKNICQMLTGEMREIATNSLLKTEEKKLPKIVTGAAQFCATAAKSAGEGGGDGQNFERNANAALQMLGGRMVLARQLSSLQSAVVAHLQRWEAVAEAAGEQHHQQNMEPEQQTTNVEHQKSPPLMSIKQQFHAILGAFADTLAEGSTDKRALQRLLKAAAEEEAPTLSNLVDRIMRGRIGEIISADVVENDQLLVASTMHSRIRKRSINPDIQLSGYICGMIVLMCFLMSPVDVPPAILALTFACIIWLILLDYWFG